MLGNFEWTGDWRGSCRDDSSRQEQLEFGQAQPSEAQSTDMRAAAVILYSPHWRPEFCATRFLSLYIDSYT